VIVPAVEGSGFTVMAKFAEAVPFPQPFVPATRRMPEVAVVEKLAVMEAVFPEGVNPVPV
jgi:hypothetical protein